MISDHLDDFDVSRLASALQQALCQGKAMHPLQLESQADESPFTGCGGEAAQGKLSKTKDFFDDVNEQLNGAFAQTINCPSDLGLKFVGHLDDSARLVWGRFRLLLEKGVPIAMMGFASGGDIGIKTQFLTTLDVGFREVAIIQGNGVRLSDRLLENGFSTK